jgi:hypothetical protein
MTQITHGVAMGSPCVGPQERPKRECIQNHVISNEERNPTRCRFRTLPTIAANSGLVRSLVARLCQDAMFLPIVAG